MSQDGFLHWIARAAKEARVTAGASEERVADLAGLRAVTIARFENAKHWPHDVDALMHAYAEAAGIADWRDIYDRALELWRDQ